MSDMSYFRNVENDGYWVPGNTYTFEVFYVFDATIYLLPSPTSYDHSLTVQDRGQLVYRIYGGTRRPVFPTKDAADDWTPSSWSLSGAGWATYNYAIWDSPAADELLLNPFFTYSGTTGWLTMTITIPDDTPLGEYGIKFIRFSAEVERYYGELPAFADGPTITDEETLTIQVVASEDSIPPSDLHDFPADRPDDYDADLFWIPAITAWDAGAGDYVYTEGEWAEYGALIAIGGGRYNEQLVVLGHDVVYFEEYS